MMEFKPGFCPNCGREAMVRDRNNKILGGIKGTKLVWLCLIDDEGKVRTRVGTIAICGDCELLRIDCQKLKETLMNSPFSGVSPDIQEFKLFPKANLELIKTYGT